MNYKLLEPEFRKSGFRFRQLIRDGDVAIFHKVHLKNSSCPKDTDAGFEVVVIGRHDGYVLGGVQIEPAETMPSNSQWGSRGWTYTTLLDAERRFERLVKGEVPEDNSGATPDNEEGSSNETNEIVDVPKPQRRPRGSGLPEISFPEGEFSIREAAELNPSVNPATVYLCVKDAVEKGTVKETRKERRAAKGKPTQLYQKVA